MKKFAIQAIALIVLIFGALYLSTTKTPLPFTSSPPQVRQLQIKSLVITVEVADTAEKRRVGLGGKETLASDSGMLFIFDKPDKYPFWMKGVKFPLDFIYIRSNKVVDIIKNAQPVAAGTADKDIPIYLPNQPIDSMLEVNGGFADQNNIQIGDEIKIISI